MQIDSPDRIVQILKTSVACISTRAVLFTGCDSSIQIDSLDVISAKILIHLPDIIEQRPGSRLIYQM